MTKPGPRPHPFRRLADAAILFAAAVEDEGNGLVPAKHRKREGDRLAKAALRYQSEPRPTGRPRTP